jgi:hypothetical protein
MCEVMPIFKRVICLAPDNKRACCTPQNHWDGGQEAAHRTHLRSLRGSQLKAFRANFADKRDRKCCPEKNHKI